MFSFAQIIGPVDASSAAVLIVMFITLCIVVTTRIARRQSATQVANEFALAKMRLTNEAAQADRASRQAHEKELLTIASNKDVEIRRIETGLIEGNVVSGGRKAPRSTPG
jgi:competence protein ComGF